MGRFRSLAFMGLGAAALSYGAYEYSTRFSDENIFQRQKSNIERVYRRDADPRTSPNPGRAAELRDKRYANLRTGIARQSGAPAETRCSFERGFEKGLFESREDLRSEAVARETYESFSQCKAENQFKDPTTLILGISGILSFLGGLYFFIASFLRKDPGYIGRDGAKKRADMENERRDSLLSFGFPPADAKSVTMESIRLQSVDDVLYGTHSTASVLRVLESYGFSNAEVQRIVLTYPGLLNRSPESISARLMEMEKDGPKTQDEVRQTVLRLPASIS